MILVTRLAQVLSWLLAATIVALSLVPPSLRPVTAAPHGFEHAGIFFLTGCVVALGYRLGAVRSLVLSIAFSGGIELLQNLVPGRHPRLSDFVVDAVAGYVGILVGRWLDPRMKAIADWVAPSHVNEQAHQDGTGNGGATDGKVAH